MFDSSGEITAPCGLPASVSDQTPSSLTPAFSHFWIRRRITRIDDAIPDHLQEPFMIDVIEGRHDTLPTISTFPNV